MISTRLLPSRIASRRLLSTSAPAVPVPSPATGGVKFWHIALGLAAPIAYYVVRDRRKTAALDEASIHLISPLRTEVEDLRKRANFTRQQVEQLQNDLRGQSRWSSEQLSSLLGDGPVVQPWEVLCLFRNSPTERHRLDAAEIAVGLSSLCGDSQLDLAWRAVDRDHRPLSFESFSDLLDRMLRTGHFTKNCLLKQTRLMPPEWSILSGQGLAEIYYTALRKERHDTISLDEFNVKAAGLSADGDLVLWYLQKQKQTAKPQP